MLGHGIFGNLGSNGGSGGGDWASITGKPTEFPPIMGNLGNVLFVSGTGSTTQSRADGLGRIDKPFNINTAISVSLSSDIILVLESLVLTGDQFLGFGSNKNIVFLNGGSINNLSSTSSLGTNNKIISISAPLIVSSRVMDGLSNRASYYKNINFVYDGLASGSSYWNNSIFYNCNFLARVSTGSVLYLNNSQLYNCTITSNAITGPIELDNAQFNFCRINNLSVGTGGLRLETDSNFVSFTNSVFYQSFANIWNLRRGNFIFDNCEIYSERTNAIFSIPTGTDVSNLYFYNTKIRTNSAQGIVPDNPTRIPNLELINCSLQTAISTGRIPTVSFNTYVGTIPNLPNKLSRISN